MSQLPPVQSSQFTTDVLKLVTGTAFAQVIAILASPIVTRLYGPESFGFYALFTSITGIIGIIACMRYELTIMLPKNDEEAINLLGLSVLIIIIISMLTGISLYFGGYPLLTIIKAPGLTPYLWLVPPFVFVNGVFLALNYWNSRTQHFGRLSIARVMSAITTTGTQLGAGFTGHATGGSLIGASLVGSVISTGVLGKQIWRDDWARLKKSISRQGMVAGLKRYKKFPLIDTSSAFLNNVSWQLPVLLLSSFFSPVIVGFYSLGMMVLQAPMSLIGAAIAQVFYQRATLAHHLDNLTPLVESVFTVLLIICVFPFLLLTVIGEDLFSMVFGGAWGEAGIYVQILSIWAIFWFISSPLSTILAVQEKITLNFKLTISNFITRLLSLIIGGVLGSVLIAITLFSVSGVLTYGLACFIFLKLASLSAANIFKIVSKCFLTAALFMIPVVLIKYYIQYIPIVIISSIVILIGYYLFVYLRDPQIQSFVSNIKFSWK